jgi:hypothetical protein
MGWAHFRQRQLKRHSPQIVHTQGPQHAPQRRALVAPPHAQGQPPPLAVPPPRALDDADHVAAEVDVVLADKEVDEAPDRDVLPHDEHEHDDAAGVARRANEDEIAARGRIEEQAEARQLPAEAHQTRDARLARAHQD